MAINQNHLFEDLNGVKCAIVEKNVTPSRVEFLQHILGYNGFTVIVIPSPPPKVAPASAPKPATAETPVETPPPAEPPLPETFTVGVTDVLFNPINAIFGRLLKAPGGHVVTLAYWQQKEAESNDEVPYFEERP
jgi:hypothetical protein